MFQVRLRREQVQVLERRRAGRAGEEGNHFSGNFICFGGGVIFRETA